MASCHVLLLLEMDDSITLLQYADGVKSIAADIKAKTCACSDCKLPEAWCMLSVRQL